MAAPPRELDGPPNVLALYAKAAAGSLPGVGRLPLVGLGGAGGDVPDLSLALRDLSIDRGHLAAYAKLCGFALRDELPTTYPHVLAFPLHMTLLTDASFPFAAMGLVHIENRIAQRRPIRLDERVSLLVSATKLKPHPRGRQLSILTEARADGEPVWEERTTILRRGGDGEGSGRRPPSRGAQDAPRPEPPPATAEWRVDGGVGRRYAAVSGDRNPIHLHPLTAKLLGFPRAIAHGMWTLARCLAALEDRLPSAYTVDVGFRKPLLLPATVVFAELDEGETIRFEVRDAEAGTQHLRGSVAPG